MTLFHFEVRHPKKAFVEHSQHDLLQMQLNRPQLLSKELNSRAREKEEHSTKSTTNQKNPIDLVFLFSWTKFSDLHRKLKKNS
jgi:hypothetical protein